MKSLGMIPADIENIPTDRAGRLTKGVKGSETFEEAIITQDSKEVQGRM